MIRSIMRRRRARLAPLWPMCSQFDTGPLTPEYPHARCCVRPFIHRGDHAAWDGSTWPDPAGDDNEGDE